MLPQQFLASPGFWSCYARAFLANVRFASCQSFVKIRARVGMNQWFVIFGLQLIRSSDSELAARQTIMSLSPQPATSYLAWCAAAHAAKRSKGTSLNHTFPYPPALRRPWAEC